MAGKPIRQARFETAPGFDQSLAQHAAKDPNVAKTFAAFLAAKTKRPPEPLSRGMRDHILTGQFSGYRECHLAGDSVLFYTDRGDVVRLLAVAHHDEMYGPKSKALLKRIAPHAR